MCECIKRDEETGCRECKLARSFSACPQPLLPPVHKPVLVCVNDDDNIFFMVAQRTHKDIRQSFVYYSPEHGEEFELHHVVDWHPLP